jgi:hypothetical protein
LDGMLYFWDRVDEPVYIDNVNESLTVLRTGGLSNKNLLKRLK